MYICVYYIYMCIYMYMYLYVYISIYSLDVLLFQFGTSPLFHVQF